MIYTKGFLKIGFIITILLFVVVFCAGCSTKEEAPPTYFEFTANDFVSKLASDWLIELKLDMVFANEENHEKMASYYFSTENDTPDTKVEYRIAYDITTNKVSYISFYVDKNFMDDIRNALTRFNYHICSVAEVIDANISEEEILATVDEVENEPGAVALYECEKFNILITNTEDNFGASFHSK